MPATNTMSSLKNSPFGKRLRGAHADTDDDGAPCRNRPRINAIFAGSNTPSLDSRPTTSDSTGPDSPLDTRTPRDYGDRFVPSRDTGDMRTSYHLMDESTPSTPSKNRIIPTESDALKGPYFFCFPVSLADTQQNKQTRFSLPFCIPKSLHHHPTDPLPHLGHPPSLRPRLRPQHPPDDAYSTILHPRLAHQHQHAG